MTTQVPDARHSAETCRWAIAPVTAPWPQWFDAHRSQWACRRDDTADVLVTDEQCGDCSRWERRLTHPEDPRS